MSIKKVEVYLQVYAYTKGYVEACIGSPTEEPRFSGNIGAWLAINGTGTFAQYTMNPNVVPSGFPPLTIHDNESNPSPTIDIKLQYQNVLDHLKDALIEGTTFDGSLKYVVVKDIDENDFIMPKYTQSSTPMLPMRVRYFYVVTYDTTNLVATFPTTAFTYYEVVLNATRSYEFTTTTSGARWGVVPRFRIYDKTGAFLNDASDGAHLLTQTALSQYDEFYIVADVQLLGGKDQGTVEHYNKNNFKLSYGADVFLSPISTYPNQSDLSEYMAANGSGWTYVDGSSARTSFDNTNYLHISSRYKASIAFKVMPAQSATMFDGRLMQLKYYEPSELADHDTGYSLHMTVTLVDFSVSASDYTLFVDTIGAAAPDLIVTNPSPDVSITLESYAIRLKKYALRLKTKTTGTLDSSWLGVTTLPNGGTDMTSEFDWMTGGSLLVVPPNTTYWDALYMLQIYYIEDMLPYLNYTLASTKSIACGIFVFELEMTYGSITKTTNFVIRAGMEPCIRVRSLNNHSIMQNASNLWTGIKDVAIEVIDRNDVDMNSISSFGSFGASGVTLNYVTPSGKSISTTGPSSWESFNLYATFSGTTTKTITLAPTGGKSWSSQYNAKLQTGSAYLSLTLYDSIGAQMVVSIPSKLIDISAPSGFDVTITPEGSEIDEVSEAAFGTV
jgi:hypothetical protein